MIKSTAIDPSVVDVDGLYRKEGPAKVFVSERDAIAAIKSGAIHAGDIMVLYLKLPASERTGYEFICLYAGSYDGELQLNPSEIEAGRFFPPTIVDGWTKARPKEFAPGFVECWKIWREKNP